MYVLVHRLVASLYSMHTLRRTCLRSGPLLQTNRAVEYSRLRAMCFAIPLDQLFVRYIFGKRGTRTQHSGTIEWHRNPSNIRGEGRSLQPSSESGA